MAADRVGLLVMDELHGAEVLRAHGPALDRRCHADTVLFATRDFLRVRVASVRQHFELVDVEHFRSEEHTSELQSLMRISYAVFCLKKKTHQKKQIQDCLHSS